MHCSFKSQTTIEYHILLIRYDLPHWVSTIPFLMLHNGVVGESSSVLCAVKSCLWQVQADSIRKNDQQMGVTQIIMPQPKWWGNRRLFVPQPLFFWVDISRRCIDSWENSKGIWDLFIPSFSLLSFSLRRDLILCNYFIDSFAELNWLQSVVNKTYTEMRNSTAMLKYNIIVGGRFSLYGESVMAAFPDVTILHKA